MNKSSLFYLKEVSLKIEIVNAKLNQYEDNSEPEYLKIYKHFFKAVSSVQIQNGKAIGLKEVQAALQLQIISVIPT